MSRMSLRGALIPQKSFLECWRTDKAWPTAVLLGLLPACRQTGAPGACEIANRLQVPEFCRVSGCAGCARLVLTGVLRHCFGNCESMASQIKLSILLG